MELGLYDQALEELKSASTCPASELDRDMLLFEIYRRAGEWETMEMEASERVKRFPKDYRWWVYWAEAVRGQGELARGKEVLRKGLRRFPDHSHILFQLACYSAQLGELAEARAFLREAIERDCRWHDISHVDRDLDPLWASVRQT
jgi:tetratricopeptide (TPR) repeat protein